MVSRVKRWMGPRDDEVDMAGSWRGSLPIPPDRWPYGPPDIHEDCCYLHRNGRYCDCAASDASTEEGV
jgi:hypothetical protein